MSRPELAIAVNALLHSRKILDADVDANYVGKLEAGKHNWIRDARRRSAFRDVLGVESDADLGLYYTRRSIFDAEIVSQHSPASGQISAIAMFTEQGNDSGGREEQFSPDTPLKAFDRLTAAANTMGWPALHPVVSGLLETLDVTRRHSTSAAPELAFADARWSEFMSWICDNGGFSDGERWLARAYARALEADDPVLSAYVLMRQSQRALDNGDARAAVALSRQALHDDALPPRTQALCLTRLAEGLALAGDEQSLELISVARERAGPAVDQPTDLMARHCDLRYVSAARARCSYLLGEHRESTVVLEDLLTDGAPVNPLDAGIWMTYLAEGYATIEPERAAAHGHAALDIARQSGSARITRALLPVAVALRQHRRIEGVGPFLAEHRQLLTAQMPV